MKKYLAITIKFGLAGATIWGIGMWVLTSSPTPEDPTGDVPEAQADIGDFFGQDGQEFGRAMAAAGLRPRAYDYNGNVMYFAEGRAEAEPREVLAEFQDHFVRYGVNEERHVDTETPMGITRKVDFANEKKLAEHREAYDQWGEAMMRGDVVPTFVSDDMVRMSGVDWGIDPDDTDEVAKLLAEENENNESGYGTGIKGYQYVDAIYEPGKGKSQITSVWTGKDFDVEKMYNESFTQQPADPNVPSCPGCTRDIRFQSLDDHEPYRANKWRSQNSVDRTYDFYRQAMQNRGWKESGVQPAIDRLAQHLPELQRIQGKLLHMEKDGRNMQVVILPEQTGGSEIISQERFEGGENILLEEATR